MLYAARAFWNLWFIRVLSLKNNTSKHSSWWRRLGDVLKASFVFVFRRCLQYVFKTSWSRQIYSPKSYIFKIRLEGVFKTPWSRSICLSWPYAFKTSSRYLQDIFKMPSRRLAKTSSKHLQDVFKMFTSSRYLQDVFKTFWRRAQDIFKTSYKDVFRTFSRRIIRLNSLPRSHFWEIYGQFRKIAIVIKISHVLA